jgi:hypothetical protein
MRKKSSITPLGFVIIFSFVSFIAGMFTGLNFAGGNSPAAREVPIPDSTQAKIDPANVYQIPAHPNDKIKFPNRAEIARREAEALKYLNSQGIHLRYPFQSAPPISNADHQAAKEIYDSGISDEIEITVTPE